MSISRPARCLFIAPSNPLIRPRIRCQTFHTSLSLRKPKIPSIKASDMGLVDAEVEKKAKKHFPKYSEDEMALLQEKYTPEQIAAIKAGEEAIDIKDLETDAVLRTDMGALPYFDDLSKLRTHLDRRQRYEGPKDPDARDMTEDELMESFYDTMQKHRSNKPIVPKDKIGDNEWSERFKYEDRADFHVAEAKTPTTIGRFGVIPKEHEINYFAPGLPRRFFDEGEKKPRKEKVEEEADPRDPDGQYDKLIKKSGLTLDQILDFKTKVLVRHRVVNQTRLGKVASIYCLAIAGNGNGRLGIGEAKGQETEDTHTNAKIAAILAMQPIPRYEERTIYGDVEGKVSAVEVKLMTRPPGFGLRCQHNIFEMARAAGIQDLAARVPRSRNKMNTVKATYQALMKQRLPDEIARGLGKKLVDVRKVYYGGRV